jgi:DnaJ family protein B protein 4
MSNSREKTEKTEKRQNYYEILGVPENADENEIKRAYMKLSLKYHPDRNPVNKEESTRKFQEINSANDVLKDKKLRAQYDRELKYGDSFGMGGMNNMNTEMNAEMHDINNIINMMFGGGMPGMGMSGMHGMSGMPGMPGGVHIFHMNSMNQDHIFNQMRKPLPIVKTIEITLELAYFGGNYTFDLERNIMRNGIRATEIETMNIEIPQGVTENEIIVLRNRGNMLDEHITGDIKICITILNHELFKRHGNDLIYQKKLSLKEALCGFSLEIKHLNGKLLTMNNLNNIAHPTIIKPGYKKVVQNMGMIRNMQYGNLFIEFEIEFPDKLSNEQLIALKHIL